MENSNTNPEQDRLTANAQKLIPLELWGPYLSERQWGTVREDYSANGDAWNYFDHDHARSRAYRWGEDGIAGISDRYQHLCFAVAVWNGKDAILKERLFGLANEEGNHGEDVKELYYHLDNTPTHSYMQYLYKYPQAAFPYQQLVETNRKRSKTEPEFELLDTGVFDHQKYFDILVTYAKKSTYDLCINITITNRSNDAAEMMLLPTLWLRNRWMSGDALTKPVIELSKNKNFVTVTDEKLGKWYLYFQDAAETLMTENETNTERLYHLKNETAFVKDAFHDAVAQSNSSLRNLLSQQTTGTKFSPVYNIKLQGLQSTTIYLRLTNEEIEQPFDKAVEEVFEQRKVEADLFYASLVNGQRTTEDALIIRRAVAGLLWSKQYYRYDVERWLTGDSNDLQPPEQHKQGRNSNWRHFKSSDVLLMPDTWEYPWFAAWDLCFHCITMAMIDPVFSKHQLLLLCREWYMSPSGQIPAYEWNFSYVNPPLQAWAAMQVYVTEKNKTGKGDINFLKRMFQKLLLNFTWWANREDVNANNIFSGGFLGLDNIGVIDRSSLQPGTALEQADATAWMGMYALNMMEIAMEIAQIDTSYEDMVTKFYEHFILIASTINNELWNEEDSFFYDILHLPDGSKTELKVRSMVGLSVLFDATVIKKQTLQQLPDFVKRMQYVKNYCNNMGHTLPFEEVNEQGDILISLIDKNKLQKLLTKVFDEEEFLAPGGLRALSKYHQQNPFSVWLNEQFHTISYVPGESDSNMFGGNSNWRGPVWIPLNYLIIHTLHQLHEFYGDSFKVEFPSNSSHYYSLGEISSMLTKRLVSIFKSGEDGKRPVFEKENSFYQLPENKDLLLFYEYYHGDNSKGLGASHQTGWSSLMAVLLASGLYK